MADNTIQTSLAGGELSPSLYARVDLAKFEVGAALIRNWFVDYRGGVVNRPGTRYDGTIAAEDARLVPFIVSQETSYVLAFSNLLVTVYREGELVTTETTPYLTADLLTLKYAQSADVLTIVHPSYPPANLSRTSEAVFEYEVIDIAPEVQPPVIEEMRAPHSGPYNFGYLVTSVDLDGKEESLASNIGVKHSEGMNELTNRVIGFEWTAPDTPVSLYNVYKWGPIDAVTMVPSTLWGFIGTAQTVTFSDNNIAPDFAKQPPRWGDPFSGGQIASIIVTSGGDGNYDGVSGDWPVIPYVPLDFSGDGTDAAGYAVIDHANGVIVGAFITNPGKNYTTISATANGEGGTGATFTITLTDIAPLYPSCVSYIQQRRVYAGSDLKPATFAMSQPGLFDNFNTTPVALATDAIGATISSLQVNAIRSLVPVSYGLLAFTSGGCYLVGSSDGPNGAISPETISVTQQASPGANDLIPQLVNYDVLFGAAKGNRILRAGFAWERQSFTTADITSLAPHLFDNYSIVDWGFAETPYKLLWVVRNDGVILTCTYVPEQEVFAWARQDTQGLFKSICIVPEDGVDAVYVIVARHIPNEDDESCWVTYLERFEERGDCCVLDAWHLDSAVTLPREYIDSPLYLSGLTGTITITSYDPCEADPGVGPFGGGGPSGEFVMEAIENWDTATAAEFAVDDFPAEGHSSQQLMGRGYDPVRRNLMYLLTQADTLIGTNDTGFTLWSGQISIAPAAALDYGLYTNLDVAAIDIDTQAVTRYPGYDSAFMVPNGIDGSDGTWRRMIGSIASNEQTPLVTDPRNGDVWFHTDAECKVYNTRLSEGYALSLSPFLGTPDDHFELFGITDDWVYVGDQGKDGAYYTLELIPRERTAEEVTQDFLLTYASFPATFTTESAVPGSCILPNGNLYFFILSFSPAWSFALYEFEPPTSAPWGGPVVGGGWTDVTPWGPATGPNTDAGDYDSFEPDDPTNTTLFALKQTDEIVCVSVLEDGDTDYYVFQIQCTYFRPGDAAWDFQGTFVSGLMSDTWAMVDKDDLPGASWAFSPGPGSSMRPLDTYREYNSYDYTLDIPTDDDTLRWFYFNVWPVTAGVIDTTHSHGILAQYRFVFGEAPELMQFLDTTSWDELYPTYTTAIGDPNAVAGSMPTELVQIVGSPEEADTGISDLATTSFWFSGYNPNFYLFDAEFANRAAAEANGINPPFLKLTYASEPDPPITGCINIGCGILEIEEVISPTTLTATVEFALGDELLVPDDPDGIIKPVPSGEWFLTQPVSTITGLAHLEGKEVWALAEGVVYGPMTVADGAVTLMDDEDPPEPVEVCNALVGLRYTSQLKTLYLTNEGMQAGSEQGKMKFLQGVTLRVDCTRGLFVGLDFEHLTPLQATEALTGQASFTGDAFDVVFPDWNKKGEICVEQVDPLPAAVLGIIVGVTAGDTGQ